MGVGIDPNTSKPMPKPEAQLPKVYEIAGYTTMNALGQYGSCPHSLIHNTQSLTCKASLCMFGYRPQEAHCWG